MPLFPGENENEQMKYLVSCLGPPPESLLSKGTRSNIFFEKGVLKKEFTELKTIEYFSKLLCDRIQDVGFRIFL